MPPLVTSYSPALSNYQVMHAAPKRNETHSGICTPATCARLVSQLAFPTAAVSILTRVPMGSKYSRTYGIRPVAVRLGEGQKNCQKHLLHLFITELVLPRPKSCL